MVSHFVPAVKAIVAGHEVDVRLYSKYLLYKISRKRQRFL